MGFYPFANIAPSAAYLPVFNVRLYGATGNGTTDDTAAVKSAINAAFAAAGGVLFFPEGNYLVSSSLPVGGGIVGGLVIQGAGWNSQIKLANGANCYIFDTGLAGAPQYTTGLTFKDLYLNCNGANQTASSGGIYGRGMVWGHIEHLWIDQPYEAGVRTYQDGAGNYGHHNNFVGVLFTNGYVSAGYGWAVKLEQADENSFVGCTFQDCGTSYQGYPTTQVYDTSAGLQGFVNCSFVTTRTTGVSMFRTDSSPGRCELTNCKFDSSTTGNLLEFGGDGNAVVNSGFLNFGGGAAANIAVHLSASNNRVSGNSFYASAANGIGVSEDAAGPNYNVVTGNSFVGTFNNNAYVVLNGANSISQANGKGNGAAATPVLTGFIGTNGGAAVQLSDTSRVYDIYLQIGTAGTAWTVTIGPTNAASAATVHYSGVATAGQVASFRLPAGWFIAWSATTATIADSTAIGTI